MSLVVFVSFEYLMVMIIFCQILVFSFVIYPLFCRGEMLELWLSPITSLNNLCGGPRKRMFGMSYNFLLRRNVCLGYPSHQLRSTSTRGNTKLVWMMPAKLLKALSRTLKRKKQQVSNFCLYCLLWRY